MITQAELDELWDFEDARGSATRFAAAADNTSRPLCERLELATQLARALGLQDRFDDAHAALDSIGDADDAVVRTRVALERGRLRNSGGDAATAIPLFEQATAIARDHGLDFLEIDALHMLAIADRERSASWAARGIERALQASDPRTRRWLVSLNNNVGWSRMDAGDPRAALDAFREAARWAEEVGTEQQREWAREAIDECEAAIARD